MLKTNKFILLIITLILSLTLTSCSGTKQLEKALNELGKESYTMHGDMDVKILTSYMGQSNTQKVESDMVIETDSTQSYTITSSEGSKAYAYTKVEDGKIKSYSKVGNSWQLVATEDIEDKNNEITDLLNIDVEIKDVFVKRDEVWVANTIKITELLETTLDDLAKEFGGMGVTIQNTQIDKYTIELERGHVSGVELDLSMSFSTTQSGITIEMIVEMEMDLEISRIGKTTVTVPEGLPE